MTPNRNPYYDVAVTTEALPEPVEGAHGEEVTERESVVTYTSNDPLADGFRDALQVSLQVPEDAAGTTIYFPTVQTCETGETAWIEIPEEGQDLGELEAPAPHINVSAGEGGHGGHDSDDASADGATDDASADEAAQGSDSASTAADDSGTDGVAVVALVVGALGLGAGGTALFTARKARG